MRWGGPELAVSSWRKFIAFTGLSAGTGHHASIFIVVRDHYIFVVRGIAGNIAASGRRVAFATAASAIPSEAIDRFELYFTSNLSK